MECKIIRGPVSHVERDLDKLLTDYVGKVISMDTCQMGTYDLCVTIVYLPKITTVK